MLGYHPTGNEVGHIEDKENDDNGPTNPSYDPINQKGNCYDYNTDNFFEKKFRIDLKISYKTGYTSTSKSELKITKAIVIVVWKMKVANRPANDT